ncbi:MAG: glycoside hydrolase family 127 protein [Clostridia bacterium]|nr:glycoside hydrolase family 127 protein [Clostridia bacterium]
MINTVFFGREPMRETPFAPLPTGAIMPKGWLSDRMQLMVDGTTGHIHEVFPDLSDDNAWLGGEGESWERGPYWLDGALPLAFMTNDEELMTRCIRYVEHALGSQREDGFFGPSGNEDWWPRTVMCKALMQYYSATGDKRVLSFMLKYYHYMYVNLEEKPFYDWAKARAGEALVTVIWLYSVTGYKFLLLLSKMISEQTLNWSGNFTAFPYTTDLKKSLPFEDLKKSTDPTRANYHYTHVVNNAMALKYPALFYNALSSNRDLDAVHAGFDRLMEHHGLAVGIFSGDEHLSGASPSAGVETCAVVEAMYSFENLLQFTGDAKYGDRLETLAFGALGAPMDPKCVLHQYLQQPNQIRCDIAKRAWYNNNDDSNIFGIEPNYGCCTANLHQGLPKYAQSLWMASKRGLVCQSYAPASVSWHIDNEPVRIEVEGNYPYDEKIRLIVKTRKPIKFALDLRIPAWAEGAVFTLDGESVSPKVGEYHTIERMWSGQTVIDLTLPMNIRVNKHYRQSVSVSAGALVFAMPIKEKWVKIKGNYPVDEFEVKPDDHWGYALILDEPMELIKTNQDYVFKKQSPVKLRCKAALIDWNEKQNSADVPPVLPKVNEDDIVDIELIPYGETTLRITQFPVGRR